LGEADGAARDWTSTVLFLGQVYTDSSTLFGINDFSCPVAIIDQLVNYCLINDYHLIIKLHPKEAAYCDILVRPYDNLTFQKISEYEDLFEKISSGNFLLDTEQYDTYSLIDAADVCVTVNSQAGLEALIKGKNVIACGNSFYTGLGFTFDAYSNEELLYFLDKVLNKMYSVVVWKEINSFFYIISEKYFIDKNSNSIASLISR